MDRSSPRRRCQRSKERRRCVDGMSANSSAKRSKRRGGRVRVMATESMTQPRTVLHVAQEPSPLRSLETEMGSVRCGLSSVDRGRNTSSTDCIKVRRTCWSCAGPP